MSKTITHARPRGLKKNEGSAKREAFVQQNSSMKLLGEIITWSAGDGEHLHKDVIAALTGAGLDAKAAREILPRHAFTRAAKKLTEERVIDQVRESGDVIKFQLTRRQMSGDEWKYAKECVLLLNKTTGKIECTANPALEAAAQKELDRCIEARGSSDITKIIQRLFENEADLFPIRDQGGVYFVPQAYAGFIGKVEAFLTGLRGRVNRFPVPADTQQGDKSVQDAIVNGLQLVVAEHEEAVAGFGLETRHDTIERAASRINATRVKVEAYAEYLKDKAAELKESIENANQKLVERVKLLTDERAALPEEQKGRGAIYEFSVVSVIRWMSVNNWTFDEAKKVLGAKLNGQKLSDSTIRAQLAGGESRGDVAKLDKAQVKELTALKDAEIVHVTAKKIAK